MSNADLNEQQTMAGVLAMLATIREDGLNKSGDVEVRKTEVVLNEVGLSAVQIALILGKKPDTVSKTLQRARKGKDVVKSKDGANG